LSSHDATDSDKNLPAKRGCLVFFDATDLHWCPDVGNGYAPEGEQIKVDPVKRIPGMLCLVA